MRDGYFIPDLSNYDDIYRAVAFFAFKYGKINWIESNNEFWLEQDARLRTDFHVTTGEQYENIGRIKNKSAMKEYYARAKEILAENRDILDKIAAFLIERETITGAEFMEILHQVQAEREA